MDDGAPMRRGVQRCSAAVVCESWGRRSQYTAVGR